VKEKAMSLFFQHGLYKTENHIGILLFVSLLEKKIELLVDQTILEKFGQTKLDQIVAEISKQFKQAHFSDGVQNGLNLIEDELLKHFPEGVQKSQAHELSNKVILD
jgi:putative membrane protein